MLTRREVALISDSTGWNRWRSRSCNSCDPPATWQSLPCRLPAPPVGVEQPQLRRTEASPRPRATVRCFGLRCVAALGAASSTYVPTICSDLPRSGRSTRTPLRCLQGPSDKANASEPTHVQPSRPAFRGARVAVSQSKSPPVIPRRRCGRQWIFQSSLRCSRVCPTGRSCSYTNSIMGCVPRATTGNGRPCGPGSSSCRLMPSR